MTATGRARRIMSIATCQTRVPLLDNRPWRGREGEVKIQRRERERESQWESE